MKKLLLLLGAGALIVNSNAQTARIQAIHNSADAAASFVDVYLDGNLLIDDFAFRTASPFIDAPAGVAISLAIAPSTSTSVADAIVTFPFTLTANETYVLVAEGILSTTGYTPDATTAAGFDIKVYGLGREQSLTLGNTDLLVHHGATDAPTVDVDELTAGNLVNDATYGDFSAYLELPTADYRLRVKDATGTVTVAAYLAPLATLNLDDQALVVVASGFLNPTVNSNGPAFGLWVALAAGGALVELPEDLNVNVKEEQEENIKVTVYPNPANDAITISGIDLRNVEIRLMDVSGKLINNLLYSTTKNRINVSQLSRGSYHILINNGSYPIHSNFIKF